MTEYEMTSLKLLCIIASGINRLASKNSIEQGKEWGHQNYAEAKAIIESIEKSLKEATTAKE